MLAGVMLLLLFVDTVVTVVLLMRYRELNRNEKKLREEINKMNKEDSRVSDTEQQQFNDTVQQAYEVLGTATPEDLLAAAEALRKMGIDA